MWNQDPSIVIQSGPYLNQFVVLKLSLCTNLQLHRPPASVTTQGLW